MFKRRHTLNTICLPSGDQDSQAAPPSGPRLGELFHIAAVGVHRVNVRALDESDAADLAGTGGVSGQCAEQKDCCNCEPVEGVKSGSHIIPFWIKI